MFFNQAESSLASKINDFKPEGLDIAYLASKGIIKLRFDRSSVEKVDADQFLKKLDEIFSDDILAYQNVSVEKVLSNMIIKNNIKISFAESITGGMISSLLIRNPGMSQHFIGSDVIYTTDSKTLLLNNELDQTEDWEELSYNLTISSLEKYGSDIALTILGEAGPISSSKYPIGTIFICISDGEKTVISDHKMNGNRVEIIERSTNKAYWELIKFIKNLN